MESLHEDQPTSSGARDRCACGKAIRIVEYLIHLMILTSVEAASGCRGDFDGNGAVDFHDFVAFAAVFGARNGSKNYSAQMDMDANGIVDFSDFVAFAAVFGTRCQRIAAVLPSASSVGPVEAGKRAHDRIEVRVIDDSGAPVPGASWRWITDERSGWVYPSTGVTGAAGRIAATWVAGSPGAGVLTLTAENAGGSATVEIRTESVASPNPPNSAVNVRLDHGGRATGYSIDVTPLTEPHGTFYAAIQWDGGYTGLQRGGSRYDRQLQFSVWDAPGGIDAQVVERGDGVICRPFGGEGTGQKCELNYPWRVNATYRFEVTEEDSEGGSAMALYVTDLASEERRFVGTLRYGRRANLRGMHFFVEDFRRRAQTCLAQSVRSAAFRRSMARVGGSWRRINNGTLFRHPEDANNPGTPPCANLAARNHAAGLEIVMGGRTASDPDAPGNVTIP